MYFQILAEVWSLLGNFLKPLGGFSDFHSGEYFDEDVF